MHGCLTFKGHDSIVGGLIKAEWGDIYRNASAALRQPCHGCPLEICKYNDDDDDDEEGNGWCDKMQRLRFITSEN